MSNVVYDRKCTKCPFTERLVETPEGYSGTRFILESNATPSCKPGEHTLVDVNQMERGQRYRKRMKQ